MALRRFALTLVFLAALSAGAAAQQQPAQPEAPLRGEPWYRAQLLELSEVLGGAHYIAILCRGRHDQRWRDVMRDLMAREPRYNSILADAFTRGYREEEARFYACDADAQAVEAELRARGQRVSQALRARHAN